MRRNKGEGTMYVIGITGGSGSGKSTVSGALQAIGYIILDADKIAREIVQPGKPALQEIEKIFGKNVINADGTMNRKAVAKIVFSDKKELDKLNKITHKYITESIKASIQNAKSHVVIDAPLLYESGLDTLCEAVVGVTASFDVRLERIMARDSLTEEEAKMRLNAQGSIEANLSRVQLLLDTSENTPPAQLAKKIDDFVKGAIHEVF